MKRSYILISLFGVLLSYIAITPSAQGSGDYPEDDWNSAKPAEVGMDAGTLETAKAYAQSAGGSGMIIRHGRVVMRWGNQEKRYDIKSATKTVGGTTALGIALKDGKLALDLPARRCHPSLGIPPASNAATGWLDEITIRHLATQTAGFAKPGGYEELLFRPGTKWHYSDGGPNWLAECITLLYGRDLEDLLFERVYHPLGITQDDLQWRNNAYRPNEIRGVARREFGSGIHANVDALARVGYLYLRRGRWLDGQILEESYVVLSTRSIAERADVPVYDDDGSHGRDAAQHYGMLWWNNADGTLKEVPRDAFWAWGLYDSLVLVIPSLDLVVVRAGERGRSWPRQEDAGHYEVLKPFFGPIVDAVDDMALAPYPPSPVIGGIEWAPKQTIVHRAEGSDNWPVTWGNDGRLYTAYGDGWGFKPYVPDKLSLGFASIAGMPGKFTGQNIRSPDEQTGQGEHGKKASGLLMVDGTLFMWVRNADRSGEQCQLAWSENRGKNWSWSDWKFTPFGYCTFINYGKNYAGARDNYIYMVSHDNPNAYRPADRFILARVPKNRIRERESYEFFAGLDDRSRPRWTGEIEERGAVFTNPGRARRSSITYNAALGRYLWWQGIPHEGDERSAGGFGVYDAPEPWGPWTTAYHTEAWDVGPGETGTFPSKWISNDGRTVHLVFSGDDYFSVRRAVLNRVDED